MNVLFLMIAYPESARGSNLYTDLAETFAAEGHSVYVATALEKKWKRATFCKQEQAVRVLRIRCGDLFGVDLIRKGISTITLPKKFIRAIEEWFHGVHFDLIVYPTPPITFASVADYFKRRDGAKTYLILRDIFPQNAKDLGMMRNPMLFHLFRRKEKALYRISDYIGCMSPGNIAFVLQANPEVPESKLGLLPNWKKVRPPFERSETSLREKYGLVGKTVALYGGNIGVPQELDFLLELAALYREREGVAFLLVGEGTEKDRIGRLINERRLINVKLLDSLPTKEYDELVHECDIGLINLNRRFTIPNIPSKTLSYFEAGIPVLAAVDKSTDYSVMLDEAQAGLWSLTGDLDAYRKNFERLIVDAKLRRQLGQNGREYLEGRLRVEQAYGTIIKSVGARG